MAADAGPTDVVLNKAGKALTEVQNSETVVLHVLSSRDRARQKRNNPCD
jgi:hypothetical protein